LQQLLDFDHNMVIAHPDKPVIVRPHILVVTAPSGKLDMFVTPSSVVSGATGRGGKVGSELELVHVEDKLDICGGVIQATGHQRFCTKPMGSCMTRSHRAKVTLVKESFYVRQVFTHANRTFKTPKWLRIRDIQAFDVETVPMSREHVII
jgi:hypothetical protein